MMMSCPARSHSAAQFAPARAVIHVVVTFLLAVVGQPSAIAADGGGPLRIVAFGDSLVAGHGIALTEAFPARLERALRAKGHDVEIANAGVSGDTTAGGLARLDWAVPDTTEGVILELGANDMLRGLDPAEARRNLATLITRIKAKGAVILLTGMRSVDNWGQDYARRFDAMFPELAHQHGVALYPFFMAGVIDRPELKLADGLHPNPRGVDELVARILPAAERLITEIKAHRGKRPSPG